MRRQLRADLAMGAALAALGATLIFSGHSLLRLRWRTGGTSAPLDLPELLAVAAAGSGIALLAWWLSAMLCAIVSVLAQQLGAVELARTSGAFAPAFMRRVVITVLGLNLLAAPAANATGATAVDPLWHTDAVATAPASPGGGTPADPCRGGVLPPAAGGAVEPQWVPTTAAIAPDFLIRPDCRGVQSGGGVGRARADPAQRMPVQAPPAVGSGLEVVVKSGDSLWSIVADALGPYSSDVDVALNWPSWYRANQETIGSDPNVIFPGQILHAPAGP